VTDDQDHYETYYADKLWNLLPAVYREQDADASGAAGPLRELVNRIGSQAAVLRRSLDRLWEDQSIETCDDWVIPYIGDLLATNLVAHLDARRQRLDVAKTVRYRRRKGTLAILEEIAADLTGWDARVVEFFRRLARTRHGLDPALGQLSPMSPGVAELRSAEGLVGAQTGTGIGGLADLRNAYGATRAGTAFDEFFHTADVRAGQGHLGWYGIPRVGVFLWRLQSFGVGRTTPVPIAGCPPGWFTFDPTGRDVPLFAAGRTAVGDDWVSPTEAQLRTRISRGLFESQYPPQTDPSKKDPPDPPDPLWPGSLAVYATYAPTDPNKPLSPYRLKVRPEHGRVFVDPSLARDVVVTYHYGFSSAIGAGPYDRRIGRAAPPAPGTEYQRSAGGGALFALPTSGTVTILDSLTYTSAAKVALSGPLTIRASDLQRPVLRLSAPWVFDAGSGATGRSLVLDGLLVSGADIVLRGDFDAVTVTCCTLDPGTAAPAGSGLPFAKAADGRLLAPCRLCVEGSVQALTVELSVTGPISTQRRGLSFSGPSYSGPRGTVEALAVRDSIVQWIPTADADPAALALADGDVTLARCTVLGRSYVHRLEADGCIFADALSVDDPQHSCVRFSAWAEGSTPPRQYESVQVAAGASLFASTDFGRPDYCQLLPTVDAAIVPPSVPPSVPPPVPPTIVAGAEDGSEMGAFSREKNPIKERGLLIKYAEYMPAGLEPVLIYVT
jgi:hypothetical protein